MLENYPDVLNIKEVCEILRISKKTAYHLIKEGEIPYRGDYQIPFLEKVLKIKGQSVYNCY